MRTRSLQMAVLLLSVLAGPASAQLCTETCTVTPENPCTGSLPSGTILIFQWENATPGDGETVTDPETGESVCTTCTACKAKLRFYLAPGGNLVQACVQVDEGPWLPLVPLVNREHWDDTNCGEEPKEYRIAVANWPFAGFVQPA